MASWDYETPYREHVRRLIESHDGENEAMAAAVGGEFAAIGTIERDLLVQWGLRDDAYLVDVGCGSGRLAQPLDQGGFAGRYLGTDVVPELLAHALYYNPKWRGCQDGGCRKAVASSRFPVAGQRLQSPVSSLPPRSEPSW